MLERGRGTGSGTGRGVRVRVRVRVRVLDHGHGQSCERVDQAWVSRTPVLGPERLQVLQIAQHHLRLAACRAAKSELLLSRSKQGII